MEGLFSHRHKASWHVLAPFRFLALPDGRCLTEEEFKNFYQDGNAIAQSWKHDYNYIILDKDGKVVKDNLIPKNLLEFIHRYYRHVSMPNSGARHAIKVEKVDENNEAPAKDDTLAKSDLAESENSADQKENKSQTKSETDHDAVQSTTVSDDDQSKSAVKDIAPSVNVSDIKKSDSDSESVQTSEKAKISEGINEYTNASTSQTNSQSSSISASQSTDSVSESQVNK